MPTDGSSNPNGYAVLIALIQTIGTVGAVMVSYFFNRNHSNRIEGKADAAVVRAEAAVVATVEGNSKIDEVSKTVNGRTDALIKENQRLVLELAAAKAAVGLRRSTD